MQSTTNRAAPNGNAEARTIVEEGEGFGAIAGLKPRAAVKAAWSELPDPRDSDAPAPVERLDVVVIGGGQGGLSVGYHLKKRGLKFVILDGAPRIGDAWRNRWDSLKLFTPALYDGLVGMRFPASATSFPGKDDMAAYLEAYVSKFDLPVRTGVAVDGVTRHGSKYLVSAGQRRFEADHVVVATSSYRSPRVPSFATELRPNIRQMHSSEYKSPSDLRHGSVLVVGAGNSGAEIGLEAARSGRETWLAGRDTGFIPFRIESFLARFLLVHIIFRVVFHRVLTVRTPIGRRLRGELTSHGGALIRVKPADLAAAGVKRLPRVAGVRDGLPLLDDGRVLDVANVVRCTGYNPGYQWIDLPAFAETGEPLHDEGIARGEPGLYFTGLPFLYSFSSIMIHAVARDAARIAKTIAARMKRPVQPTPGAS